MQVLERKKKTGRKSGKQFKSIFRKRETGKNKPLPGGKREHKGDRIATIEKQKKRGLFKEKKLVGGWGFGDFPR